MNFCSCCGNTLAPNAKFCQGCGTSVSSPAPITPETMGPAPTAHASAAAEESSVGKRRLRAVRGGPLFATITAAILAASMLIGGGIKAKSMWDHHQLEKDNRAACKDLRGMSGEDLVFAELGALGGQNPSVDDLIDQCDDLGY